MPENLQETDESTCAGCGSVENLTEVKSWDCFYCPGCLKGLEGDGLIAYCRYCGRDVPYPADEVEDGLCADHETEDDLEPEGRQDMEDYYENITKDG